MPPKKRPSAKPHARGTRKFHRGRKHSSLHKTRKTRRGGAGEDPEAIQKEYQDALARLEAELEQLKQQQKALQNEIDRRMKEKSVATQEPAPSTATAQEHTSTNNDAQGKTSARANSSSSTNSPPPVSLTANEV